MINVSAVGTILTFEGQNSISDVTFKDASDMDAPISFGEIEPFGTEFDLNHNLVVQHKQVTPEFSVSFIPGSASDRKMRAFLLSSLIPGEGNHFRPAMPADDNDSSAKASCRIGAAYLEIPDSDGTRKKFTFKEGYLVGGSVCLGANTEGRLVSNQYKFVFKGVTSDIGGNGSGTYFTTTEITKNTDPIENLFYARVSASSSARMISHPIESGASIFDHKFREPTKVEVRVKVPQDKAITVEADFNEMLNDRQLNTGTTNKTQYIVNTKTNTYENLSLIGFSHEETPDAFDLLEYTLTFQELLFSSANGETKTTDPGMSDTQATQAKGTQDSRPTT